MSIDLFKSTTVLITGASSGIGEAFARSLSRRGANLILTARSADKLALLANELKEKHHIAVHVFPADISRPESARQLFDHIKASGLSVDVLINNAGFGKWAHFLDESIETYEQMLSVNINALVKLTHLCAPEMIERRKGGIINVASTAAVQPVPYIATYSASKAFVLSFTEALAGEYLDTGVRFMALCPGNTATNFAAVANAKTDDLPEATAEEVAEAALTAFAKGRSYYVPGLMNYLTTFLPRILTRAQVIKIVAGMFKNKVRVAPISVA
ncbi:MAG TPA: SDR family oxidoreductase [Gallionella sp.]|nr:SDR family oxidoreductase [Gallionella sp.]